MAEGKVAVVLGGGSARGLAHIGVLKVFQRHKIPVDFVVGTSIGSLVGALYALDIPLVRLEEMSFRINWWKLTDFVISKTGFLEGRNLEKIINKAIDAKGFEDLKRPLAIVATDIENGEEVVLTSGNLCKAIRASCSIPGIFSPARIDGRLLVDGGLKKQVPSDVARRMGATFIIAVDVGYCIKKGKITNIFQVVFQAIQIIGNELSKVQTKQADVAIKVRLGEDIDQMAFDKSKEIIKAGQIVTEEIMPMLKGQLKEEGFI